MQLSCEFSADISDDANQSAAKLGRLQKAIGVDIDLDARRALDPHAGKPPSQHRLEVDLAPGFDEKPAAMSAAQQGERRRGWTEHGDAGELWYRTRQRAGG